MEKVFRLHISTLQAAGGELMEEAFTVICQQFFSCNYKTDKRTEFPFDVILKSGSGTAFTPEK